MNHILNKFVFTTEPKYYYFHNENLLKWPYLIDFDEMKLIKPLKSMCTKDQKELKEVKKQIVNLNRKIQKITDKIFGMHYNLTWNRYKNRSE